MENLYINWKAIIGIIGFIIIGYRLLLTMLRWTIETKVIAKVKKPADITVQGYLYWIGRGIQSIFWLIVMFLWFFVQR
jgi:hypothetical protein